MVSNCYATGDVIGGGRVGGLVGEANNCVISNCYATGDVMGANDTGFIGGFGGLTGIVVNGATIENSYAAGAVYELAGENSWQGAGGISGLNYAPLIITNSVALNPTVAGVSASVEGRIWGYGNTTASGNLAINSMLNGLYTTDWLIIGADQKDGESKSESELKTDATYKALGWNFDTTWGMGENGYPVLRTTPVYTGISKPTIDVSNENVVATEYYNLQGVRVAQPQHGSIYIVRAIFESGKNKVSKVIF